MGFSPRPVYIVSYINSSIWQSPGRVPAQWQTFNRRVVQAAMSTESVLPDASGQPSSQSDAITKASLRASRVTGSGVRSSSALILRNTQKSVTGRAHPTAGAVSLVFAIAHHAWVGSANRAAVRIAMTVGERVAKDDARESGVAERGSDPDSGQPTRRSAKPKSKSGSDPLSAADPVASPTQSSPSDAKNTGKDGLVTGNRQLAGRW